MKRVLVINASGIGERTGTGRTLDNLWDDYPRSDLLQLLVTSQNKDRNEQIITVNTPMEFCSIPYLMSQKRKKGDNPGGAISKTVNIAQKGLKAALIDAVRGMLDSWPVRYRSIDSQIEAFGPQVIYTCGASIRILKVALHYSKRFRIPIIIHLMDDWPETIYTTSVLSVPFHRAINVLLKKAVSRGDISFAISEALADKYQAICGVRMLPLMNPAKTIHKAPNIRNEAAFRFIYAGSLSLNRWKSLLQIAEAINEQKRFGYSPVFDLYVPKGMITQDLQKQFYTCGATLHPYITVEQLEDEYRNADVVVFTESFDRNVVDFIRLSLSTKVPEYMGTGNVILAYLPAELHSSDYIKTRDAGYVVNAASELVETIHAILSDPSRRVEKAENALRIARKEHSHKAETDKLYAAVENTQLPTRRK